MTAFDYPDIPDCATDKQTASFCTKPSDNAFHLSPFVQLHENTISPVAYDIDHAQCSNVTLGCSNSNSDGDYSSVVAPGGASEGQSCEVSRFYLVKCAILLTTRIYSLKTHPLT